MGCLRSGVDNKKEGSKTPSNSGHLSVSCLFFSAVIMIPEFEYADDDALLLMMGQPLC